MRKLLNVAVTAAGIAACLLLATMVVVMFAAIVLRQLGILLPGHEEITTFAMVGMAFLGLPYAYRTGAHVRVETLLSRLSAPVQRKLDAWCVVVAMLICAALSYFVLRLTWDSYVFGDVSEGLLAVPRWIPQLPMFVGLALFVLSLLDDLVVLSRGGEPSFAQRQGGAAQAE